MQVLGHVDLAAAVLIERVEALPQLVVAHLALLTLANKHLELVKIELIRYVNICEAGAVSRSVHQVVQKAAQIEPQAGHDGAGFS